MNLGNSINTLRKQKNVTQEELAAELGVTAAAVSKWENGYTLPDILMLCALADYFEVTTDELLGRNLPVKYAVIASITPKLGEKIKTLAKQYGIIAKAVCSSYTDALAQAQQDSTITLMLLSLDRPLTELEMRDADSGLLQINVQCSSEKETLAGFELYFQNMDTLNLFGEKGVHAVKHTQ